MLAMYVLVADDTDKVYTSEHDWQPQLFPYQQQGSNVLFLTFLNPAKMPAVPPGMAKLARSRGSGRPGAVPASTAVLFAIGGQAYSEGGAWGWLTSRARAEAMGAEVAQWPRKYGCDGIDLDIETGAGSSDSAGENLAFFVARLKKLQPRMIVTLPVFGSPSSVPAANRVLEASFNRTTRSAAFGSISRVGIMSYSGTNSESYLDNYVRGCSAHCSEWYCPVAACVPTGDMVLGAAGSAGAPTIMALARAVRSEGLGGIMVWEASLRDAATGGRGLEYGPMDASIGQLGAWADALGALGGGGALVV